MLHFVATEFDSPDLPGSGAEFMDEEFLNLLDRARDDSAVAYVITSGFRTPEHSESLKKRGYPVARNSAHLRGLAADILARVCYLSGSVESGLARALSMWTYQGIRFKMLCGCTNILMLITFTLLS